MRGKWPYIMLFLAIVLGMTTTYLVYRWMEGQVEAMPKGPGLILKPVVVAALDLAPSTKLRLESLKVINWPWNSVPKTAASDPKELVDRVVLVPVAAGEPILQSKLAAQGIEGGMTAIISPGKRALSVKVDEIIGVAGFVLPGASVDVIVTIDDKQNRIFDAAAKTVLQNIKVLAVGQKVMQEKDEPVLVNVVTLEVTLEEAEKLALSINRGRLQLALRNQSDDRETPTGGIHISRLINTTSPVKVVTNSEKRDSKEKNVIVEVIRGDKRSRFEFKE